LGADFLAAPKLTSNSTSFSKQMGYGIETLKFAMKIPRDYDIYLCEGTYIFPALAKKLGLIKGKIINIAASPIFYWMTIGEISGLKRSFAMNMAKEVDGFISGSYMIDGFVKELFPDARTIVSCPFILPERRAALIKSNKEFPKLDSKRILTIGTKDPRTKGIDLLVNAFLKLRKSDQSIKLNIVGNMPGIEKYLSDRRGIELLGSITDANDMVNIIKSSALYVHMGRGETFGISIIESMLGGLPCIVSNYTGTKKYVEKVSSKMVVPLDSDKLAEVIDWYFKLPVERKRELSKKSIKYSMEFERKRTLKKFLINYKKMIKDIKAES
jgi:glycosyltransferase involved in cell wall biosynthesis